MTTPILLFADWRQPIPSKNLSAVPSGFGLEEMLAGANWSRFQVTRGPDGCAGEALCLAPGPNGKQCHPAVDLEKQAWTKVRTNANDGVMYFLWEKDAPPNALDLQHEELIDGWPVKLGDGNEWIIPVIEPRLTTLPLGFRRGEDGKIVGVPKVRYETLIEQTAKWLELVIENGEMIFHEVVEYCTRVLQLNYRVHVDLMVQGGLELLDDRSASRIIDAAVGVRTIQERKAQATG